MPATRLAPVERKHVALDGQKIQDIRTVIADHQSRYGYDPPETYLVRELRGGFPSWL